MKKGIAIRTILLLVVGILVVGILVYLVYKSSSTVAFSVSECRSRLMTICDFCMNNDWDDDVDFSSEQFKTVSECKNYAEFFYWSDNTGCCDSVPLCGDSKGDCKHMGLPV